MLDNQTDEGGQEQSKKYIWKKERRAATGEPVAALSCTKKGGGL